MTQEHIDAIAAEVLRRLKKRVLILLTNARGYRTEIYARLRVQQSAAFSFLLAQDATEAHCPQRWGKLGPVLTYAPERLTELGNFDALLLPFLDFSTLSKIANGVIDNEITEITSQALLRGIRVLAFDYNCNPASELNAILGCDQNSEYSRLFQQHIKTASGLGMQFISVNELVGTLTGAQEKRPAVQISPGPRAVVTSSPVASSAVPETTNRYITLQDLMEQRVTHLTPEMKLTALAQEYLKENREKGTQR
ncbi:MAG: hypothetical protein ACRC5A_16085 [Enterobacteriaceae bacterium]